MNRHSPSRRRGFTLVELLIVMALLSLVMLAMGSALRTASQTEERVDVRLQRMDDLRIVNSFLRSVLGRISAQKMGMPVPQGSNPFFFAGESNALSWVGVMPARYGTGGRHHFRLELVDGGELRLRFAPWVDATTLPDWSAAQTVSLLSGVTGLAFQYEDAVDEPPLWNSRWTVIDRLPDRIVVSLQTAAGTWPDLVIPLRVLPGSDPRSSSPSFGGSGR